MDIDAPIVTDLRSRRSGVLVRCHARIVGEVVRDMGGGRQTKATVIDPRVGLDRLKKPGDAIKAGDALCRIHAGDLGRMGEWQARLLEAFTLS